jgi:hypothetical protein
MLGGTWRSLVRRHIIYDISDEMVACFDCNVWRCPDDRYETCADRLPRAAELRAARAAEPSDR